LAEVTGKLSQKLRALRTLFGTGDSCRQMAPVSERFVLVEQELQFELLAFVSEQFDNNANRC